MIDLRRALAAACLAAAGAPALAQVPADPQLRVPLEHWGCTNCHQPDAAEAARVGRRPGPELSTAGTRLSASWMRRWIDEPSAIKPAASMPALFGDSEDERADLEAVVHYLASLGEPAGGAVAAEESVLEAGRELYHTLGCVHCHGALESPAAVFGEDLLPQEVPRVFVMGSFGDLAGKWRPAALAAFLRDPLAVHRDARMPGMSLTEGESDLLATYLLSRWGAAPEEPAHDPALARRGREVFQERGCQACHVVEGERFEPVAAAPLGELPAGTPAGCVGGDPAWAGPRYAFPAPPMARLFAGAIAAAQGAEVADPRRDLLERTLTSLNCRACHEVEGRGGVVDPLKPFCVSNGEDADLGDEGRYPPHLNGVGAKLTTPWFEEVLLRGGRARPYLATRMPQYGEAAAALPALFAHAAGVEPDSDATWPEVTDDLVLLGREMMGMDAFACVNCHSFGDRPSVGTPGPNLQRFAERLRYAWWDEYIEDPGAMKPGTRMPKFTDDAGRSVYTKFCGGDFQRQTDAMWAYFTLGEFMPPPPGLAEPGGLMLQVGDRPRVFRTYLDAAGARGIAVGFPVGVHYAYDAEAGRLTQAWQGEFLDASGAWAGRGGNSRGAGGEVLWTAPAGPALLVGRPPDAWPDAHPEEAAFDFQGYRTGSEDGPEFRWEVAGASVRETNVPRRLPRASIERRFRLEGLLPRRPLWFRPGGELLSVRVQGTDEYGPYESASGETWFRVVPSESSCRVVLEVAL